MYKLPLFQVIWQNIRKWARENKISDDTLAVYLRVNVRTLATYDITAHALTLEKLSNLSEASDVNIIDFIPRTMPLMQLNGKKSSKYCASADKMVAQGGNKDIINRFKWKK